MAIVGATVITVIIVVITVAGAGRTIDSGIFEAIVTMIAAFTEIITVTVANLFRAVFIEAN